MADKVRGALNQIDWSKSNQVSINVKPKQQPNQTSLQQAPASKQAPASAGDVPINQYRSIVAPVKSGKEEEKVVLRKQPAEQRKGQGEEEADEEVQVYLGYLGSLKVPKNHTSTGIVAIQAPMRELYFPYREKKTIAQERVINVGKSRLEVYYMSQTHGDVPETLAIEWKDILYVEPLKFSTKKLSKDKKNVRAAFEPCESQRLAMLGNRDSLFTPLHKQHKHISLLKHPALLCMVVLGNNELYTHGYICSTVEESVFLAKKIRDEIEFIRRESLKAGQVPNSTLMGENLVRGDNSYTVLKAPSLKSKVGSKKNSSKKKDKGTYSTHTGDDEVDFGSFHFGLAREEFVPQYEPATHDDEINQLMNQNFLIGRPGVQNEARQKSRQSFFSEIESGSVSASGLNIRRSSDSQRPVGVVQPAVRDGFKVLPSDISADKTKLKPTVLNIKTKRQSEITPELDLKLKMRQKESEETILNPLAPRSVVNPLAETHPEHNRKLYISPTPGPISKMSTSLPFNPSAALPQSSWHESVIGNFKSKEKIENRLTSQMVDAKELPKMKSDKKQSEIENLFSNVNLEKVETQNMGEENFAMTGSSPMNRLHEAMGFMP